jgi:plastocyanin
MHAPPPPPARVQIAAQEFRYILSRTTITSGPAIVELVNFGEDPHDLRLRRIGGTKTYASPIVQPGEHYDLVFRNLAPGRYRVWCSVADHAARGMRGLLVVKKRQT